MFAQRIPVGNLSFVSDCEGWLFRLGSVLGVKNIAESGTLGRLFNFKFGEIETRFFPETHDKGAAYRAKISRVNVFPITFGQG